MKRLAAFALSIVVSAGTARGATTGNGFEPRTTANPCPVVQGVGNATRVHVSPDGGYVYVVGDGLGTWRRESNGFLSLIDVIASGVGGSSSTVATAISPDGATLYVGNFGQLRVYALDPLTGIPTLVQTLAHAQAGDTGLAISTGLVISPDGEHVYVTGRLPQPSERGGVTVLDRDPATGLLTVVETLRDGEAGIANLARAEAVTISADGNFVYVAGTTTFDRTMAGVITLAFTRNASTGQLTLASSAQPAAGDSLGITLSPDGAFAYVSRSIYNQFGDALSVLLFSRNAGTGALTWLPPAESGEASFTLSPDGAHAYSRQGSPQLRVQSRNPVTGRLTQVGFDGGFVRSIGLSPDGQYLFGPNGGLAIYTRDATTGMLSLLDQMADGATRVTDLTMSPGGEHVYASCDGKAVVAMARDGGTGALSVVDIVQQGFEGVDALNVPQFIAASPDGRHVYARGHTGEGTYAITALARDQVDGSLSVVGTVPCRCGPLRLSPDGRSLYTIRDFEDELVAYDRDPVTGVLTFRDTHPSGDGGGLFGDVLVSPDDTNVYATGSTTITVWNRDLITTALTLVAAEPFDRTSTLVSTSDGSAIYAVGGRNTPILARNPTTGRLSLIENVPDPLVEPTALTPDGRQLISDVVENPPFTEGRWVFRREARTQLVGFAGFLETSAHAVGRRGLVVSPDSRFVYSAHFQAVFSYERKVVCDASPRTGCRQPTLPRKSSLKLTDRFDLDKNRLLWNWSAGEETLLPAFGDPTTTTNYALCIYDGSAAPQPALGGAIPAGDCSTGTCWRASPSGFTYGLSRGDPDGVRRIALKAGAQGKASVKMKGGGGALAVPDLPFVTPVRAQVQASNGECWEATFSTPSLNTTERFKAFSD